MGGDNPQSPSVGSLFSGIGGLDLGLERAGMTVAWQAEVDPYCCRVLNKHWPHVPNLGDVTAIDWVEVPRVDVIAGGYPCQPFSLAGLRGGDADPRHLWPHMLDAIRVLRPRWVLLENVPGHLSLGFGRVLGDLAGIGYDAEWSCLSACSLGAPHTRERLFVVAYPGPGPGVDGQRPRLQRPQGGDQAGDLREVWLQPEPRRVAPGVPSRVDRLAALGNAVVPQVAERVGRLVLAADKAQGAS